MSDALIQLRPEGLYCPAGDFHIDPWRPVPRALITHGHADHARSGMGAYDCAEEGLAIVRHRLADPDRLTGWRYGERRCIGAVEVSFHPAGHILGSAQIRIDDGRSCWVVTGDYKRAADATCAPFEVVPCDVLISEATFALPCYRWPPLDAVVDQIVAWWDECARAGRPALLLCYALGKAQRLLAAIGERYGEQRCVYLHGAMTELVRLYREAGVAMAPTALVSEEPRQHDFAGELILAPPSAAGSPWMKRLRNASTAFASGWMLLRGNRRRRGFDRGFVLSDHADWPALQATVRECGAQKVYATHGQSAAWVRYLNEQGVRAAELG